MSDGCLLSVRNVHVYATYLLDNRGLLAYCSLLQSLTNYLVDPASSHMLVSKIKPCMSKNKPLNGESANGSLNQLLFI